MADNATDREVLDFIHDLFLDRRRWIKGTEATNAIGTRVQAVSDDAACFCLTGALRRYAGETQQRSRLIRLLQKHIPEKHRGSVVAFNDAPKTNVEDVRSLLKCAALDYK